jgi:drug/metabolite transporter (DMT)-like permease
VAGTITHAMTKRPNWSREMHVTYSAKGKTPVIIIGLGTLLGSSIVWTKVLTEYMTTVQIVSTRIVLASLTMFALLAVRGELRKPRWTLLRGAVLLGIFDSLIPYLLMAFAASQVEAGLGAVLIATMPLFTAVFAAVPAREERLSVIKVSALVVGFMAVVMIAGSKDLGAGNAFQPGHAAFLAASVTLAASTVYGRRLLEDAPALEVSAWKLAGASVLIVPVMLATGAAPHASAFGTKPLLAMLFVGVVSTGLARTAYLWASGVIGSTNVSLVTYVMPSVGLIMAWLVLGEQPAPKTIAGLILIFASIAGVTAGGRGRHAPARS